MAYNYPYGDTQQLNLNWFLAQWETFREQWATAEEGIDHALDAEIARVEAAMSDLYAARDAAAASQAAAQTAAVNAASSQTIATQQASLAQSQAATAQNQAGIATAAAEAAGNSARSASNSASNANLSKVQAGNSATAAGQSATLANEKATAAGLSAAQAGVSAANAAGSAEDSEAWAVGERGGTPVASGDDTYENNSKYYADQAAAVAASIPEDYTELSDDVSELKTAIGELTNNVYAESDVDWNTIATTTYTLGWRTGYWSESGIEGSTRRICSVKSVRCKDAVKLTAKAFGSYKIVVYEYDENDSFVEAYGGGYSTSGVNFQQITTKPNYGYRFGVGQFPSGTASDYLTSENIQNIEVKFYSIATSDSSIVNTTSGTATVKGIKFTTISKDTFELSGTPSSTNYRKWFNYLLGGNTAYDTLLQSTVDTIRNITKSGRYTLFYKPSRETDGWAFTLVKTTVDERINLVNGESFTIENGESALLIVQVLTTGSYSEPLTIKWQLYYDDFVSNGAEYSNTNVDLVSRAGVQRSVQLNDLNNLINTYRSWGANNVIALTRHIKDIKWTPVANMPKAGENQFFSLEEQTGIPYSSVRDQDKAVGMDVSIHTFMTAVKDPNSVLYKRRSTVSNSSTYYGTVCSGMVNYAFNINLDLTNTFLGTWDAFEDIPMMAIQPGDVIWIPGHIAVIKDVLKDSYGRIEYVIVTEEWSPLPRNVQYTWSNFLSNRDGYIARRYKGIDGIKYTSIPYVQCFDEEPTTIVYPDVQTEFGDKAVFMKGEDVVVNVIDPTGYTNITVTRGSTQIHTTSTISTFTLSNVQAGLHTITATGNGKTSTSTFFVVDATASFNDSTGVVTFSSTNATPVMVGVYDLPSNREMRVEDIILTDADRTAGQINVLSYITATRKYAKVWFKCDYGTAVWYSETHEKWIPVT